MLARANRQH